MKSIKGVNTSSKFIFFSNEIYLIVIIALIAFTSVGQIISLIFSVIYYPVIYTSTQTISFFNEKLEGLNKYADLKKEYDILNEKLIILEEINTSVDLIQKENIQLKEQLKLNGYNNDVIQAETLEILKDENSSIINKGKKDSIKEGDTAYIGNTIIGSVTNVDNNRSRVQFINANGVSIKGVVLSKKIGEEISLKNLADKYMQNKLVDVVVLGKGDSIVVENIPFGKVSIGDLIVVADQRYDRNYIVGYILSLDQDIAKATQSGKVKQFFDIYSLSYYYFNK